jgi:hypothetical protein
MIIRKQSSIILLQLTVSERIVLSRLKSTMEFTIKMAMYVPKKTNTAKLNFLISNTVLSVTIYASKNVLFPRH